LQLRETVRVTLANCDEVFKCAACEVNYAEQGFAVLTAATVVAAPAYYRVGAHEHTEL
jgi:hypothetical protein